MFALRSAESWIHHLPLLVPMLVVAIGYQAIPQKSGIQENKDRTSFQQGRQPKSVKSQRKLPHLLSCIFPMCRVHCCCENTIFSLLWTTTELQLCFAWYEWTAESNRECWLITQVPKTTAVQIINIITALFCVQKHQDNSENSHFLSFCLGAGNSSALSALKSKFDDGLQQTVLRLTEHPQGKNHKIKVKNPT